MEEGEGPRGGRGPGRPRPGRARPSPPRLSKHFPCNLPVPESRGRPCPLPHALRRALSEPTWPPPRYHPETPQRPPSKAFSPRPAPGPPARARPAAWKPSLPGKTKISPVLSCAHATLAPSSAEPPPALRPRPVPTPVRDPIPGAQETTPYPSLRTAGARGSPAGGPGTPWSFQPGNRDRSASGPRPSR